MLLLRRNWLELQDSACSWMARDHSHSALSTNVNSSTSNFQHPRHRIGDEVKG